MPTRSLETPTDAKRILVVSDLHITKSDSPLYRNFIDFLKKEFQNHKKAGADHELWLLGDIFDFMVGPFDFWLKIYSEFFIELTRLLNSGVRILWIQGNHDFFIEGLENKLPKGIFIRDDFMNIEIVGFGRCFLAHGDLVDLKDRKYQRWRAITRKPLLRAALSCLPQWLVLKYFLPFGQNLSQKSRKKSQNWESNSQFIAGNKELFREFSREKWSAGFRGVFLGHNHISDQYTERNHFLLNCGSSFEFRDGRFSFFDWNLETGELPRRVIWRPSP